MRGVSSIAALVGAGNPEVTLCHCLYPRSLFRTHDRSQDINADDEGWRAYHENRFRPYMEEAAQRLAEAGVSPDRINREILMARGNIIQSIIKIALSGNFGTVVVGHRRTAGFWEMHVRGRFSDKIIESINNCSIWVVS